MKRMKEKKYYVCFRERMKKKRQKTFFRCLRRETRWKNVPFWNEGRKKTYVYPTHHIKNYPPKRENRKKSIKLFFLSSFVLSLFVCLCLSRNDVSLESFTYNLYSFFTFFFFLSFFSDDFEDIEEEEEKWMCMGMRKD